MIIQIVFCLFSLFIYIVSLIRLNFIFSACYQYLKNNLIDKNIQSCTQKGFSHV